MVDNLTLLSGELQGALKISVRASSGTVKKEYPQGDLSGIPLHKGVLPSGSNSQMREDMMSRLSNS